MEDNGRERKVDRVCGCGHGESAEEGEIGKQRL